MRGARGLGLAVGTLDCRARGPWFKSGSTLEYGVAGKKLKPAVLIFLWCKPTRIGSQVLILPAPALHPKVDRYRWCIMNKKPPSTRAFNA